MKKFETFEVKDPTNNVEHLMEMFMKALDQQATENGLDVWELVEKPNPKKETEISYFYEDQLVGKGIRTMGKIRFEPA